MSSGEIFYFLASLTGGALIIYEWVIIIAILVSWVHPDPRNPIIQFLNLMTQPFWDWLRNRLPNALSLFTAYISLLLVWFMQTFIPGVLRSVGFFSEGALQMDALVERILGFFLLSAAAVFQNLLLFLVLLLVIWFVVTLISPSANNPIVQTLYVLVDPFLTPVQRWLPRLRFDISPLVVAGIFLFINVFVISQLVTFAFALTHSGGAMPLQRMF